MRRLIALVALLLCINSVSAQSAFIKGVVVDTAERKPLHYAVVSLLHKKDSTLAHFTRTNKNGDFRLEQIKAGTYLLLVTYPKFADYSDEITINEEGLDAGKIPLTQQAGLLQVVIIRCVGAIRIKSNTVKEFLKKAGLITA